jgi:hypothetical protein
MSTPHGSRLQLKDLEAREDREVDELYGPNTMLTMELM